MKITAFQNIILVLYYFKIAITYCLIITLYAILVFHCKNMLCICIMDLYHTNISLNLQTKNQPLNIIKLQFLSISILSISCLSAYSFEKPISQQFMKLSLNKINWFVLKVTIFFHVVSTYEHETNCQHKCLVLRRKRSLYLRGLQVTETSPFLFRLYCVLYFIQFDWLFGLALAVTQGA